MSKKIILVIFFTLIASILTGMETGGASWYGGKFQGRLTANGEIFDTNTFTAAHKTLPFNTIVEVTNLGNNKSVMVRINDRGPFVAGRIIDLSRAAAGQIGLVGKGVCRVRLKIITNMEDAFSRIKKPAPAGLTPPKKLVTFQIASFSNQENAITLVKKLRKQGLPAEIEITPLKYYRVVLKNINKADVDTTKGLLIKIGFHNILIKEL